LDAKGGLKYEFHYPAWKQDGIIGLGVTVFVIAWVIRLALFPVVGKPPWAVPSTWHQLWVTALPGVAGIWVLYQVKLRAVRFVAWWLIMLTLYEATAAAVVGAPVIWLVM
jgi:hypothetical protein